MFLFLCSSISHYIFLKFSHAAFSGPPIDDPAFGGHMFVTPVHQCTSHQYILKQPLAIVLAVTVTAVWLNTSGYAMWFMAGGAIHIAHYDVIDDVITPKL